MWNTKSNRRNFLLGAAKGAVGATAFGELLGSRRARAQSAKPRFLIVIGATGGASIIDSLMAIRESESANAASINCFPDALVQGVSGSPFRAVDLAGETVGAIPIPYSANQSAFVSKHKQDLMVATVTGTSVNHAVAQKRSITGNEAWSGRTLQEVVAAQFGDGYVIPNVNMATGTAFLDRGTDQTLPSFAYGEPVVMPETWPLALDGMRGQKTPSRELVQLARRFRDEKLDPSSKFYRVFESSPTLARWLSQRGAQGTLEGKDLITKLMLYSDSAEHPLSAHGLSSSPDAQRLAEHFPNIEKDPLEAQAALAFLLLKNRVSVTVTLGPGFNVVLDADDYALSQSYCDGGGGGGGGGEGLPEGLLKNPPLAFDFSHQSHRATQAVMWDRLFGVMDSLITLLKEEELEDGESFWDRSLIYVATDFGRSKNRTAGSEDFGSGHDLNNGVLVVSPLANGNQILGGVDPNTALTYGFDPRTGAPDPNRTMAEADIYSGVLGALGVDTSGSGLSDVPAMRRA